MKHLFTFVILCLLATAGFSQLSPDKAIDEFWENYETKSASEALDMLYQGSHWLATAKDDIENLKAKFESLPNIIGEYNSQELLVKKTLADSYIIYIYMVKYDRQPMRIQFEFYKPDKEWELHGFVYDFDLTTDFEEYVKQESLK